LTDDLTGVSCSFSAGTSHEKSYAGKPSFNACSGLKVAHRVKITIIVIAKIKLLVSLRNVKMLCFPKNLHNVANANAGCLITLFFNENEYIFSGPVLGITVGTRRLCIHHVLEFALRLTFTYLEPELEAQEP
jgi:hypothetical protein